MTAEERSAIDEICAKVKRGEKLNQDEREIMIESILDDLEALGIITKKAGDSE